MTLQDAKDGMEVLLKQDSDVNFRIGVQRCQKLVNEVEQGAEAKQLEAYKGVVEDILKVIYHPKPPPEDITPIVAVQVLREERDELRSRLNIPPV